MPQKALYALRPMAKHLSRGIDYLGELGAKLRDLKGYDTLASELIQNADDAAGATMIRFDVRESALVVDNDGVFTDCGSVESNECAWSDGQAKKMCDFHRFRSVASGNKREEEGTTGAFGIGFTSVYQITDGPELISNGRHWLLSEEKPENERITVCEGCGSCRTRPLPGTRFLLPWASNATSTLRTLWRISHVTEKDRSQLVEQLRGSLPLAVLFLKKLKTIELLVDGKEMLELSRRSNTVAKAEDIIITGGNRPISSWKVLTGSFDDKAKEIRQQYPGKLETKRRSIVQIAVAKEGEERGLFYATLPTQHPTKLPIHINADFFPTNNRKQIIFDIDYQSEWNRSAICEAASVVAESLPELRDHLGAVRFWKLAESFKSLSQQASRGEVDSSMADFWEGFGSNVDTHEVVLATNGDWKKPHEIYLLDSRDETSCLPILEELGIPIVIDELRPLFGLLRECGVPILDVPPIAKALSQVGLTGATERDELPRFIKESLPALWEELHVLLHRKRKKENQLEVEGQLKSVALAPTPLGSLVRIQDAYRADISTQHLFSFTADMVSFLDETQESFGGLRDLCPDFTVGTAIDILERLGQARLQDLHSKGGFSEKEVLGWFEERQSQLGHDSGLREKLASLPMFPSSSGLKALTELAIPGDFKNDVGIADIVDLTKLDGRRDFLLTLAPARELTFEKYVREHVPEAFKSGRLSGDKKQEALRLLASRLGSIKDDTGAKEALEVVPLAECEDGEYRRAQHAYLPNRETSEILQDTVHYAVLPDDHAEAARELLRWLGSPTKPRLIDVVARIRSLANTPPNESSVRSIGRIAEYLIDRMHFEQTLSDLFPLRSLAWLPEKNDRTRWYSPTELYASYQESIFASQGKFLGLPLPLQRKATSLMDFLGIKTIPEPPLVVAHLLYCSENNIPVKADMYQYLDQNCDHSAVRNLRAKPCLYLPDRQKYIRPDHVFWGSHNFGRFRIQLGNDLLRYGNLFKELHVKQTPEPEDALAVLMDISSEFGVGNNPLDDEAHQVVMHCWKLLSDGLDLNQVDSSGLVSLASQKVIPDPRKILSVPSFIFFEEKAGIAVLFEDVLKNNIVPRQQGAWRAMRKAGVRSLDDVIESSLVECDDPVGAEDVKAILEERRIALQRIIDAQQPREDGSADLNRLSNLKIQSAKSLRVVHTLKAFRQVRQSEAQVVDAVYRPDEETLYFVPKEGRIPWAPIAKELALAVDPTGEPGQLSPGFYQVLSASSYQEASAILDQLGYPRLEQALPLVTPPAPVATIGGELSPEEAVKAMLGTEAPPPSTMPPGFLGAEIAGSGSNGGAGRKRAAKGRLRSYVSGGENNGNGEPQGQDDRIAVGERGVSRVMEYERKQGRVPEEMPHENEGYDVISRDANDNTVRYIEVKSLTEGWTARGVEVSKPQFNFARDHGQEAWLYVVENVNDDENFQIHPIHDPANRVTTYMFDDGWKAVVEDSIDEGKKD